jgi:hypothetical protein
MPTPKRTVSKNSHLKIVVAEGRVTMEDLHKALDIAVKKVTRGGCNCGLTGFDVSFVRGDPALTDLVEVRNIQTAVFTR